MTQSLPAITRAAEGLALELKSWLDPTRPPHVAVIVRALIALRNHGGGSLLVGYENDGSPRTDQPGFDVTAAYHVDRVQDLVSKHASERFEIAVTFEHTSAGSHPRIDVPTGICTPVRVRTPIVEQRNNSPFVLLASGEVPVRTLESNGRPSTSPANERDWERLMQVCFDNREADVGRFIRRHLSGVAPALSELIATVKAMPSSDQASDFLELGRTRFETAFTEASLPNRASDLRALGGREVALVISPVPGELGPTQEFLHRILSSAPRATSYPPWLDTNAAGPPHQPQVLQGRWESLIYSDQLFDLLTFNIFDPTGKFYERRLLLPDVIARRNNVQSRNVLGERQALTDVAEVLITGLAFASALDVADEDHMLHFAFRWSGLSGRHVDEWFMRGPSGYVAVEDTSPVCRINIAADTPPSALAPAIEQVMAPMFAMFRGYEEPSPQIGETLLEVIERRSKF